MATTPRLRIESLRASHAAPLFPVLADERIYRYIPESAYASAAKLTERFAFLERGAPAGEKSVWLNWALQRLDTSAYIGTLQATVQDFSHAYIGYVLGPPEWGKGYATEACGWLVDELQRRFTLAEIRATVDVRNRGSMRVLERLGFRRTGTERAEIRGKATLDYRYALVTGGDTCS